MSTMKHPSIFLAFVAASAVARAETPAAPPELLRCAAISRSSERLACYDQVIAALAAGKGASGPAATPESSFGLLSSSPAPSPNSDAANEDLKSVTSTVKGFGRADDGGLVLHLDNGQSWKQISGFDLLIKRGDAVTINRAALGSFQLVMPNGRSAKVRRVD
jgi:hypothetical protein